MPLVKSQWNPLMETTKFILIRGGGHARVVSSIIEAQETYHLEGIFDSNPMESKFFMSITPTNFRML